MAPGASLYGIPFSPETSILAYRTDIFDEYDLEVPTTYDELLETAQFITDNVPECVRHDHARLGGAPGRPRLVVAPLAPGRHRVG